MVWKVLCAVDFSEGGALSVRREVKVSGLSRILARVGNKVKMSLILRLEGKLLMI